MATLKRARQMAGGTPELGRALGIGRTSLEAMLLEREAIPTWLFLRIVDYINDAEARQGSGSGGAGGPEASGPKDAAPSGN